MVRSSNAKPLIWHQGTSATPDLAQHGRLHVLFTHSHQTWRFYLHLCRTLASLVNRIERLQSQDACAPASKSSLISAPYFAVPLTSSACLPMATRVLRAAKSRRADYQLLTVIISLTNGNTLHVQLAVHDPPTFTPAVKQ